jgi:hypothetical protein
VFKRLLENDEAAKFIISTLLKRTVLSIDPKSQEFTFPAEEPKESSTTGLRMVRLDFVATIQIENGEHKKVLIEMQKVLKVADIMRFRNYLGEQYKREDTVNDEKQALPIIVIYILGFELPGVAEDYLRIDRQYYNKYEEIVSSRSYFIECVTHDCVVVQAPRIQKTNNHTKLDKLLSVFEQKYFTGNSETYKDYPYLIDDKDIQQVINILHYCASDVEERKRIEAEEEAWRTYKAVEKDNIQMIENQAKQLAEKEAVIVEKEAVIVEKDAIIVEKEAIIERERKEKERERKEKEAAELALAREREEKNKLERLIAELLERKDTK